MAFTRTSIGLSLVSLLLALAPTARADEAPLPPGVRGEIVTWLLDAEKKLTELASVTPEAKYGWRPAKDARSTGEVFMHVAGGNYGIPSLIGVKPPAGFDFKTYEKSLTKKADIDQALKDSFAHSKKALLATTDAELDKPAEFFGMKTTVRGAYLLLLAHAHEHLGQSIAHARSNKIAPPWTARMNAKFQAAQKAGAGKKPE